MISPRTVVFDLDGTLVDTAPDLINALNYVLDREGLPPVPPHSARNMIGAGARRLIERGLELEGRSVGLEDINRLTSDFIEYYAAHIADASRPFDGLESALDDLHARGYRFAGRNSAIVGPDSGNPAFYRVSRGLVVRDARRCRAPHHEVQDLIPA